MKRPLVRPSSPVYDDDMPYDDEEYEPMHEDDDEESTQEKSELSLRELAVQHGGRPRVEALKEWWEAKGYKVGKVRGRGRLPYGIPAEDVAAFVTAFHKEWSAVKQEHCAACTAQKQNDN